MTDLALKITEHLLEDSIKLHLKSIESLNKHRKNGNEIIPFMNLNTKDRVLSMVQAYGFERWIIINNNIKFQFISNGHVPSSSSIILEIRDEYEVRRIFISGDTSGARDIPFTKKLDLMRKRWVFTDYILESTYGGNYIKPKTIEDMVEQLHTNIQETCIEKKAKYLLPVFSFARSTNLLLYIKKTIEKYPEFKNIPIYAMSPLMCKCHQSIGESDEFYDDIWKDEMDLFKWNNVTMVSDFKYVESILKKSEPCIILSSAGMGTNGFNSVVIPAIISGKKNHVSFTGYLSEGTEGYKIINKQQKTITSYIDGEKKTINVKATTSNISGLSSHCSGKEMCDIISKLEKKKVKNIILQHGDFDQCDKFRKLLRREFDEHISIHIPRSGEKIKLT